jgi:hypothetical protein
METVDAEYLQRENEKVLKTLVDEFYNKYDSSENVPPESTLFVDFHDDSGELELYFSQDSAKDFTKLYEGVMNRFDHLQKQCIFAVSQENLKRKEDFMVILDIIVSQSPYLKNLNQVIPLKKILSFLELFWTNSETKELQSVSFNHELNIKSTLPSKLSTSKKSKKFSTEFLSISFFVKQFGK